MATFQFNQLYDNLKADLWVQHGLEHWVHHKGIAHEAEQEMDQDASWRHKINT